MILAKTVLEEALDRHSGVDATSARVHDRVHYGDCLVAAGRFDDALRQFDLAAKRVQHQDPSSLAYVRATSRKAETYSRLFKHNEAIALWNDFPDFKDPTEKIWAFHHVVLNELNSGDFKSSKERCELRIKESSVAPAAAPIRVVASFTLAFFQLQDDPKASRKRCDRMLETQFLKLLSKKHPEDFAFMYLWTLLNKSQSPSLVEIKAAKKQLENAIELTRNDHHHMVALAHHTLALANAAEARQSKTEAKALLDEALKHQSLAVKRMPKHHLFLQSVLEERVDRMTGSTSLRPIVH